MAEPSRQELKELIVNTLDLPDVSANEIGDEEPLIGAGLDLDSLDALELVLAIEKKYGISIANAEESKQALTNIASLAQFIGTKQAAG